MSTSPEIVFSCEGIAKCYAGLPVLRDISLELPRGGFVSLLGPSGVGKTTLFNVLAGVDRPDAGRVFLEGADITGISGRVSYMLQKDLLLEYRTVLDNVILPLLIRGVPKAWARRQGAALFPQFTLEGCEAKYPRQLSGGMRQRAALLRTCMTGNSVILLDEPFSALDAITRLRMHRWYQGIAGDLGLSTFCITHDVDEAISLSDRLYILNRKPGEITHTFTILPPRPREKDFSTSAGFSAFKKAVLEAIGL